jgi:hypothetical protein
MLEALNKLKVETELLLNQVTDKLNDLDINSNQFKKINEEARHLENMLLIINSKIIIEQNTKILNNIEEMRKERGV